MMADSFDVVWCGAMRTTYLLPERDERIDSRFDSMPVPTSEYDERRFRRRAERRQARFTHHSLLGGCAADRERRKADRGRAV